MAQKEKENVLKLFKRLRETEGLPVWCQRLIDSPYGGQANRKPFDGLIVRKGFAVEAKFQDGGLIFNLAEWRRKQPNQEAGLRQYYLSGTGEGILLIFWKPKCKGQPKNRIQVRWEKIRHLLGMDTVDLLNMKTEEQLIDLLRTL